VTGTPLCYLKFHLGVDDATRLTQRVRRAHFLQLADLTMASFRRSRRWVTAAAAAAC
jgi:hypothetical protein